MDRYILVHYHEVGLKKNNREFFERKLKQNIELALHGLPYGRVRRISGRLLIQLPDGAEPDQMAERLRDVFGIAYFAFSWLSNQDLDRLAQDAWSLMEGRRFSSFAVNTKRGEKSFPLNSVQISAKVGAYIGLKSGARVDLEHPDLTCFIEIVETFAFLYFEKRKARGGLPVSTGGRVAVLLSGGIDSPVAAYRIIKRGCRAVFVHFHSFPHTTLDSQEKVRNLVRILARFQYSGRLYLVPFADIQRQIVAFAPPPIRIVLYRRFMVRIAEALAFKERAGALVTGESIGQVASQTLENIRAIAEAATLPILRPLIGDDKQDIISLAQDIGTLETSIQPDQDCCTLFIPKHPHTKVTLPIVRAAEAQLDVDGLVSDAVSHVAMEDHGIPSAPAKADGNI
ncbi:MAG: tRNA 4-thiouridine(8) synthase ThiI [Acidobacteria bacterium]|nr:tRNA 4-thiouridine(8) synthase ThiI [Acidobacteriota bacterium]MBI3657859.1 tRNA 4-thiouridine(8) synthase ThiI [Acidobacteriota bacterium]